MAFENLGQSFLPRGPEEGQLPDTARLEDVLRVLSFRLPRILGARPIAPAQLLSEGPQNVGSPFASAIVQGILQNMGSPSIGGADAGAPSPLSQLFAPMFGSGSSFGSQVPPPSGGKTSIIPIEPPTADAPSYSTPSSGGFSGSQKNDYESMFGAKKAGNY